MDWIWLIGLSLGAVGAVYLLLSQQIQALEVRMKHMSKRIEQLEAEVTLEEPAINGELRRLIAEGQEIRAIKAARLAFGYSLLEAKQYIDGLKEND
ncbi:hypothetical protein AUC31_11190 [Planococcus rifietoensis]|uniref:Ribosomal protein L7/L12 C-terminal domain-containing protein n=1 Tax=Planococcus rifietoensis TaxID=200991 RepID=A0A0U2YSB6_9BACL|nr:hypothetical protein [Planococcus rifietoensis]ALS75725.1 hypothetical protein AUC31_11190 [Planococcus rifietoensis]